MTDTTTQGWKTDALGVWTPWRDTEVTAEATIAYAKATNAAIEGQLTGAVAPPVFAIVPPFTQMTEAMVPIVPQEAFMRVVHGEQDMRFHQPIVPGMTLRTRMTGAGLHTAPGGVTLHSKLETTTADGEPVNEQWSIAFFRGVEGDFALGEQAPSHRVPEDGRDTEPVAVVTQAFDADQTYRYSEASGDLMPIHLDDALAKQVGLPGIIIHGLCTMAFNANAIVEACCGGDTARLKRLAVRFSRPNLPDTSMTTQIWRANTSPDGVQTFAFESANDAGAVVIKDGLAEVEA